MALLGALVPEIHDIDAQEQKFLIDLVNRHEGNLTLEVFKGYRKLAHRMNTERAASRKGTQEARKARNDLRLI